MLGLFTTAQSVDGHSWFDRLKDGLQKTRARLGNALSGRRVDESLFEELESALISADAGVEASSALIDELRDRARRLGLQSGEQLQGELQSILADLLAPLEATPDLGSHRPCVIMIAGVNGAGKTTSIGKLARFFSDQGRSVLLAAGDTFRAAAREQLAAWGEKNRVSVISQQGGDPGAVVFDAVQAARARGIDIVLADTAGRLPTQLHLMDEVRKIRRVIAKADPSAPHEIWLVLDANTGQNALAQVHAFDAALGLTGLILTKLDGTAKGGVIAAVARAQQASRAGLTARRIPLVFIGVGEGVGDLRPFSAREFAAALIGQAESARS